jgi:hypothetical protein
VRIACSDCLRYTSPMSAGAEKAESPPAGTDLDHGQERVQEPPERSRSPVNPKSAASSRFRRPRPRTRRVRSRTLPQRDRRRCDPFRFRILEGILGTRAERLFEVRAADRGVRGRDERRGGLAVWVGEGTEVRDEGEGLVEVDRGQGREGSACRECGGWKSDYTCHHGGKGTALAP